VRQGNSTHMEAAHRERGARQNASSLRVFFFLLWLNYFFEVAKNGFYSFSSRQILKRIKNFFKNRQISLWGFTIVAKKM
jgi:hypothetical protein